MRGSLKTSEARFSEAKTWLNALLLPHIVAVELELLLAPVLLWLMSGTIGWFAYLPHVAEWTSLIIPTFTVLLIIAACLFSGCRKRHGNSGKWLISLAVWLWFAYGFVLLGVQY